jgi:hypothetical protein
MSTPLLPFRIGAYRKRDALRGKKGGLITKAPSPTPSTSSAGDSGTRMFFHESSRSSSNTSPSLSRFSGSSASRGDEDDGNGSDYTSHDRLRQQRATGDPPHRARPSATLGHRSSSATSTTGIEDADELGEVLGNMVGTTVYISVDLEAVFQEQELSIQTKERLNHCVFSAMVSNAPVNCKNGMVVNGACGSNEDNYFLEVTNLQVMEPYEEFIDLIGLGILPRTYYNFAPKGKKPVDAKEMSALIKLAATGKGKLLVWHEVVRSAPTSQRLFAEFRDIAVVENECIAEARRAHKSGGTKRAGKAPAVARGGKRAKPSTSSSSSSSSTARDYADHEVYE